MSVDAHIAKQRRQLAEVHDAATPVHRMADEMGKPTMAKTRTKADVVAEIGAIAKTIQTTEKDDYPTMAAAKAEAWTRNPELVTESRTAGAPVAKAAPVPRQERTRDAVHARALEMSAIPAMWVVPVAEIRDRIWTTKEGQALTALARDTRADSTLRKSGEHAEAFRILKAWEKDPKDGLTG